MRLILRRRPSPAMVVACIALLVALGGTSIAAVEALPSGSVGTAQLKNNAVTAAKLNASSVQTSKIAAGAVKTNKISNGAVTTAKLANDAVTGAQVKDGSLVAADLAAGVIPSAATPAISEFERVDVTSMSSSAAKAMSVTCPAGKRVISGGTRVQGGGVSFVTVTESFPDSDTTKWNAIAREAVPTALSWTLQVYALCAKVA